MKRYNHAMTVAFEVISNEPEMPTFDEIMTGLRNRIALFETEAGRQEAEEALLGERPFDTYEMEEVG